MSTFVKLFRTIWIYYIFFVTPMFATEYWHRAGKPPG